MSLIGYPLSSVCMCDHPLTACTHSYLICSRSLTLFCPVILRNKSHAFIVSDTSDIQRASRVSSADRHTHSGSGAACCAGLFVGLCETASLSQLKRTLSIFDLRRSDGGIGVYTPGEEQHGRGRWLWRWRQVGIIP